MAEPSLIARQHALLHNLARLAADRGQAEPAIEQEAQSKRAAEESAFDEDYQTIIIHFASQKEQADREVREVRETIRGRFETEQAATARELARDRLRFAEQYDAEAEEAQAAFQEARWTIDAVHEASRSKADKQLQAGEDWVTAQRDRLLAMHLEARRLVEQWKLSPREPEEVPPAKSMRQVQEYLADVETGLARLKGLVLPRFLKGRRLLGGFVLLGLVLVFPLGFLVTGCFELEDTFDALYVSGLVASAAVTLLLGTATHALIASLVRSEVQRIWGPICQALAGTETWRKHILESYTTRHRRQVLEAEAVHARDLKKATDASRAKEESITSRRAADVGASEERARQQREASEKRQAGDLREAEGRYAARMAEAQQQYERDAREEQERHERTLREIDARRDTERQALAARWREGTDQAWAEVGEITRASGAVFPFWDDPCWDDWTPPAIVPEALRFGEYRVQLDLFTSPASGAESSRSGLPDFNLPALCPFPEQSLLFEAGEAGRSEAVAALQAVMFRLLTAFPPGKVRFTIVDPVGLGENFAAFMHLADYDAQLVASRIWTEQQHIEQRLADLTAHMENVIQKYLRNQYRTIAEYNEQAGEVAEPFRVLVVANFPANFTTEAARRLVSIAQSGARCGVTTLITVDTRQRLPQGFDLADLEQAGATLVWRDGRFTWKDPDFGRFPLTLDAPPDADFANRLLHEVGERARVAGRVEVPFEFIAPPPEQRWTGDSRLGLDVALGRAGATKRQYLRLGQGTSQHVLVAGKTGSGKSTLLHALITNLALLYSPDEVELYLVDFKKGVEFKTYAVHELPHARVVAIESEREFGLSVLQRLDAELRLRGERFRDTRAQDLNAYRQARPGERIPRILLIVDEFQEFFVEDDRMSQEASQLLDRLVRQGRAFGLHVLLGSQTLGGAYSLARSTIDQMAVRIALQCSEADAHLILSEGNSAARLLSRPGEAIYNDANGRVEGNNPFQVVWLPDARREAYLGQLREMDRKRRSSVSPLLVFEGNAPADVGKNYLLSRLLEEPDSVAAGSRGLGLAWLGEAIAIKDPTAATFIRQGGSNLLVVGQQDEAALGMLATAVVSLAAQEPHGAGARFYLVDGSPADAPQAGLLARLADVLPHSVRVGGWRDVPAIMAELTAEVDRRQKNADAEEAPVYVVLYGLQRLRDLRRQDDDYGFMRRGEESTSPSQQFATLLREGAGLGIHLLAWCDTLNNLQRTLDRPGMREFGMRVVFQMSVADSSNLIDSPLATKLGVHRALFANEETGTLEKFRPYRVPSEAWLARVRQQLRRPASVGS